MIFPALLISIDTLKDYSDANTLHAQYTQAKSDLNSMYIEASAVVAELASLDPMDRQSLYQNQYEELQKKIAEFDELYDSYDRGRKGMGLHSGTLDMLQNLQGKQLDKTSEASLKLEATYDLVKDNGLVLQKGQTRQNGIIHAQIVSNLFQDEKFHGHEILSSEIWDFIQNSGGWPSLNGQDRWKIQKKIIDAVRENKTLRGKILEALYEANPLSFEIGGNGYPEQTRTLLDRFKIRACYRLKFDQGIISDAGAFAAHDQTFIAEMFGMDKMRHMMLNEDRDTLPKQPDILGDYIDTAGFDTRARRKDLARRNHYYDMHMHGRDIHDQTVMIPCSDSTKIAGQAAEYENICIVREHIRNLSTRTLKNKSGEAIEIKWAVACLMVVLTMRLFVP